MAAQAELVGGVGDGPGQLVGARELAVDGRGEGSDAWAVDLVGDRAADRVGECLLELGAPFGRLPGLEVCTCDRGVEMRERASVRPDAADRFRCGAQAGDGLQRLSPMLVKLGARHLDQRGELAGGLWMGSANSLQPGRSVVGVAQGDQSDEQLHHPRRVGLDRRRAELVQPQADRPHGEVRLLQGARRTTERGPHDPARTIRVGHRHGLLQRTDVIPTILEGRTRPIMRRPEPRGARRCQPRPEKRREQVVVAVPAPPLIQGHYEQVGGD